MCVGVEGGVGVEEIVTLSFALPLNREKLFASLLKIRDLQNSAMICNLEDTAHDKLEFGLKLSHALGTLHLRVISCSYSIG